MSCFYLMNNFFFFWVFVFCSSTVFSGTAVAKYCKGVDIPDSKPCCVKDSPPTGCCSGYNCCQLSQTQEARDVFCQPRCSPSDCTCDKYEARKTQCEYCATKDPHFKGKVIVANRSVPSCVNRDPDPCKFLGQNCRKAMNGVPGYEGYDGLICESVSQGDQFKKKSILTHWTRTLPDCRTNPCPDECSDAACLKAVITASGNKDICAAANKEADPGKPDSLTRQIDRLADPVRGLKECSSKANKNLCAKLSQACLTRYASLWPERVGDFYFEVCARAVRDDVMFARLKAFLVNFPCSQANDAPPSEVLAQRCLSFKVKIDDLTARIKATTASSASDGCAARSRTFLAECQEAMAENNRMSRPCAVPPGACTP